MKLSDEFKIGVLTVLAVAVLILGYNFLKGNNLFSDQIPLVSVFESANGLSTSDPVYMYGTEVGKVEEIEVEYGPVPRIVVEYAVDNEVLVPINSVARIFSLDLLGTKALEIVPGNANMYVGEGDTLRGELEVSLTESINEVLNPLQERSISLITSLDSLITVFQEVLDGDTKDDIEGSFQSIAAILNNLEQTTQRFDNLVGGQSGRIEAIVGNVEHITQQLQTNMDTITAITSNVNQITDSLAAADFIGTVQQAQDVLTEVDAIVSKINRGEGTLGELVNNDELYEELEASSEDLDKLLIDIRQNPHRYLNFSVISLGGGGKAKVNREREDESEELGSAVSPKNIEEKE